MTRRPYVRHRADPVTSAAAAGAIGKGAGGIIGGTAGAIGGGLRMTWQGVKDLATMALEAHVGIPLAVGLGGGWAAARLSGPVEGDIDTQEKQIVNGRVRTMTDENIRRLAADLAAYRDSNG